jgi:FtsZ-binding cell division protein ZapB
MLTELDKLEERIGEAVEALRVLREEREGLAGRLKTLETEKQMLLDERAELAERIARLVDKVDALRLEI